MAIETRPQSTVLLSAGALLCVAFSSSGFAVPPDRLNVGGLGELVLTTIDTDAPRYLSEVAACGDVDGDGLDDLLLRVHLAESAAGKEDAAVVVYGSRAPAGSVDPLGDGVRKTMIGTGAVRNRGAQIAGGEDIDGDGLADFVAASGFEESVGGPARLVVLGAPSLPEEIEVGQIGAEIRGTVVFDSSATDPTDILGGEFVVLSPDINGDGHAEILVAETARIFDKKRCFVLFGAENLPPRIDLVEVGASVAGFTVVAPDDIPPDGLRGLGALTSLGDVNGDGLADLGFVVKNIRHDPEGGFFDESFLVFGRADFPGVVRLDSLRGGRGIRFPQYTGLARGGDVDGDGLEDPVLSTGIPLVGVFASVLYSSRRASFPDVIDLETFRSRGLGLSVKEPTCLTDCEAPGSVTLSLGRGKDLDGDGRSDVLLGASGRGLSYGGPVLGYAGAAFFLRGGDDLPDTVTTGDIPRGLGVRLDGIDPQGRLGTEVFMLDDFDGDGAPDIVLTSRSEPCSEASRKVWIVSGRAFRQPPPPRIGLIRPEQGWIDGGNLVAVFGTGFDDAPRVHFGSREAEVTAVLGSGILIVAAPPGETAGDVPVRVITGGGQEAAGELGYTYRGAKSAPFMLDEDEERTTLLRHFESDYRLLGAATGDFNGDTRGDVVLLDAWRDPSSWEFHIVFGREQRGVNVDLEFLGPRDGVTLGGSRSELGSPSGVAAGGDIDGDGFDDFVALFDRDPLVEWRVILGRREFPRGARLKELARTISFVGDALDSPYQAAAIVPDVSGDGIDDLLIATRSHLYVVKGRERFPDQVSLDRIVATGQGATYDTDNVPLSTAAGPAGDFNGDGVPDVFFAGRGKVSSGAVVILYGGANMFPGQEVRLREGLLRDAGGLLVTGRARGTVDFWAAVPGDLDGDGLSEIFLNQTNRGGCTIFPNSGEGFVFNRETVLREGFSEEENRAIAGSYGDTPLGVPDFVPSRRLQGRQEGVLYLQSSIPDEMIGLSAGPAGDFNADGYGDLLVGGAGKSAYVVFGGADFFEKHLLNLTYADDRVMVLESEEVEEVASFVSGGFDWDGDGVDDILLGGSEEQGRAGRVRIVFGVAALPPERTFIRGDANANGGVNLSDAVLILAYLFSGLGEPACLDALDVNDDGSVNLTDAGVILLHLFSGGPQPPPPYPDAGSDPTADDLRCNE